MKRIWKFLVMGMLVAVAGRSAQAGSYSDTPLSPGNQPPPPGPGYDLLLAQNTSGPTTTTDSTGKKIPVPAESWTTDLQFGDPKTNGNPGIQESPPFTKTGVFAGTGPTGVYPTTVGVGKHTEYTKGDIMATHYWTTGTGVVYQYVFHVTSYNPTSGKRTDADQPQGYHLCP